MELKARLLELIIRNAIIHYHASGDTHRGKTIILRGMCKRIDLERFCQDAGERLGVDPSEIEKVICAIKDNPAGQ